MYKTEPTIFKEPNNFWFLKKNHFFVNTGKWFIKKLYFLFLVFYFVWKE